MKFKRLKENINYGLDKIKDPILFNTDGLDNETIEVLRYLDHEGYDANAKDVRNYADAVAEYIDTVRSTGEDYSVADWYRDTTENYPEELNDLSIRDYDYSDIASESLSEAYVLDNEADWALDNKLVRTDLYTKVNGGKLSHVFKSEIDGRLYALELDPSSEGYRYVGTFPEYCEKITPEITRRIVAQRMLEDLDQNGEWEYPECRRKYWGVDDDSFYDDPVSAGVDLDDYYLDEDVPGGHYYWPGSEDEWESEDDAYGDEEIPFDESLNEDYSEDRLKRLISAQHFISPKDRIQLFTTPKGNYEVRRNGKKLMIIGKDNFRESEIEDLRLNGYFDDYDKMRMNESLVTENYNDYSPNGVHIDDMIDWISSYDEDLLLEFFDFMGENSFYELAPDQVEDFISSHEKAWHDYCTHFNIITLYDEKALRLTTDELNAGQWYESLDEELSNIEAKCRDKFKELETILLSGQNADVENNIKKAFKAVNGKVWFKEKSPTYLLFDGKVGNYTLRNSVSLQYLKGDLTRLAEDLVMAYNVLLGGEREYTPNFIKRILNSNVSESKNSLKESNDDTYYNSVIQDLESIEAFLRKENFTNFDVSDYHVYPMQTSVISFVVEGDWKHDHLYFKNLLYKWSQETGRDIFKIDEEEIGESDSDWYTSTYKVFITKDEDTMNTLNSMRGLFESKDSYFTKSNDELSYEVLSALRNFKKHAQNGDELKIDIDGNKGEVSKEADGWYLYYGGLVTQGSYKIIEAAVKDAIMRAKAKKSLANGNDQVEESLIESTQKNWVIFFDENGKNRAGSEGAVAFNLIPSNIERRIKSSDFHLPKWVKSYIILSDYKFNKLDWDELEEYNKNYGNTINESSIREDKKSMQEALDNGNDPHKNIDLGYIKGTHWSASIYDKTGNIYLRQHHPYDDAEYCWAYSTDNGKTFIIVRDRKRLETFKADPKEKYRDIIARIGYLDKNTKSRMLYNSLDTRSYNLSEEKRKDFMEAIYALNKYVTNKNRMTNKEIVEALNRLDNWAINNDSTFYDLKTFYEAYVNPNSPVDKEKKQKIEKALSDPSLNKDKEKLQDYIAGVLARKQEALGETFDDEFDAEDIDEEDLNEYMKATKVDESDKAETDALEGNYTSPVEYKGYTVSSSDKGRTFKVLKNKHIVKGNFNNFVKAKDYINTITEDLEDDLGFLENYLEVEVPDVVAETEIVETDMPAQGQDIGLSDMILDSIESSAEKIREYNSLSANLGEHEDELKDILEDISVNENETLGKLQSMLKVISPNAENIMNGAVEAEELIEVEE